jgi:hypothetical protein
MFVMPYILALFINIKIISMNTTESIFKEEINIAGLIEIFRVLMGDVADILAIPSCISYLSVKED